MNNNKETPANGAYTTDDEAEVDAICSTQPAVGAYIDQDAPRWWALSTWLR